MKNLNTNDFIQSYRDLRKAKYPSLTDTAHVALSAILTVSIEWGKDIDQIQNVLDTHTAEMRQELSDLSASISE